MARFRVATHIDAPPERLWDLLRDWEGSAEWMVDATVVEVLSEQREGVGTRVRAVTRIAGVALTDVMTVTAWEPARRLEVFHEHRPIRGVAWFGLIPEGDGTGFEWVEDLRPPLGLLGEIGGRVLRAPIEWVLRKSLTKLKRLAEATPSS
ncbi:MAG: SRPBCC family protein [Actinomycetota bacterium]